MKKVFFFPIIHFIYNDTVANVQKCLTTVSNPPMGITYSYLN